MEHKTISLKNTARAAGLYYLILIILGIYGLRYVQSQVSVKGNDIATAKNILDHEFLFRSGIFSSIAGNFIYLLLVLAMYSLLKHVNERMAKVMVVSVIVQIPISFMLDLCSFTSLMVLKGEVLKTLSFVQKQDFAMLFLRIRNYGISILELYWGIWLIPLGQLIYKSGIIPWIIGVLLILGGIAYIADGVAYLLFPESDPFVSKFTIVASVAELSVMLWLLIKGVNVQRSAIAV